MITRETIKEIVEDHLDGFLTAEELSDWAFEMISEKIQTSDELVKEILYNLVCFDDDGFIFNQYRPSKEKLKYFMHWLNTDKEFNWDQYNTVFDPSKLM